MSDSPSPLWIKVCGVTTLEDAEAAFALGADAVGINLIPTSKRAVPLDEALRLSYALGRSESTVFVVANLSALALGELRTQVGDAWLQLHGEEPREDLLGVLPRAYKALPIDSQTDVENAASWPGERLLLDAKVGGAFGGTGQAFDWSLVVGLARSRPLVLAGGLNPGNVAEAVQRVRPFGVDVASGVEVGGAPRRTDLSKVAHFIQAARAAHAAVRP